MVEMGAWEPMWLRFARADLGLREIPGTGTSAKILRWLIELGAWWRDDETPWCGVACAAWMKQCGIAPPKAYYRAKAWLEWGRAIDKPVLGCVVVFGREGGGHVALAVGTTKEGRIVCIGGNQGNSVSQAAFPIGRVLGYRVPPGERSYDLLPVLDGAPETGGEA